MQSQGSQLFQLHCWWRIPRFSLSSKGTHELLRISVLSVEWGKTHWGISGERGCAWLCPPTHAVDASWLWHRLSQVCVCCLCKTWAQHWLIQGFSTRGCFKSLRILRVTGLGRLPGDQHRQIRVVFLIWVLPRASLAKLIQKSLPAHAVWCEVHAPPKEAQLVAN